MTASELAKSYLAKAALRFEMLSFLFEREAWSDVVREAQELVELAPKGMLRQVGVDPPKWHDVGPILLEEAKLLPEALRPPLPRRADISKQLRKEREFALYGDVDFIPTREYSRTDLECRRTRDAKRDVRIPVSPCARRQPVVPQPPCVRSRCTLPRWEAFRDCSHKWLDGVSDALA